MNKKFDALETQKELLLMKAELQRMEFGGQINNLKKEFAWIDSFRKVTQWFGRRNMHAALGPIVGFGGQAWQNGMRKHPIMSMVVSTVLLRFSRPLIKIVTRAGLGAAVLGAGALWFQMKSSKASAASSERTMVIDPNAP